jgi:molecular chaperone HscA
LINARNDASQLMTALAKQLKDYSDLIGDEEKRRIDQVAAQLEAANSGNDRELITQLVEQLNELSTPFAERIMNYAISRALEKKSIDELS